jgi:hypothetical protein
MRIVDVMIHISGGDVCVCDAAQAMDGVRGRADAVRGIRPPRQAVLD